MVVALLDSFEALEECHEGYELICPSSRRSQGEVARLLCFADERHAASFLSLHGLPLHPPPAGPDDPPPPPTGPPGDCR
jgi:hypothetical protein